MKNKLMKRTMIITLAAGALAATAATTTALVLNNNTKTVNADLKASTYVYVNFSAGNNTSAIITGTTKARVKPGKTFHSVTRPVATRPGYTFQYWTLDDVAPGAENPRGRYAENTEITDNVTLYPYFTVAPITKITVDGPREVKVGSNGVYKAYFEPSTVPSKDVKWTVANKDGTTGRAYASIVQNTGALQALGLSDSHASTGTYVIVTATSTQDETKTGTFEVKLDYPEAKTVTIATAGEATQVKVGSTLGFTATVAGSSESVVPQQQVTWQVKAKTGATTAGAATIVQTDALAATLTAQRLGEVTVTATSIDGKASATKDITIINEEPASVTVYGQKRLDIKDTPTYTAVVKDASGATETVSQSVTWHAYSDESCTTATTLIEINETTGVVTVLPAAYTVGGVAYIQAHTTQKGQDGEPSAKSSAFAVEISDLMSTMYTHTDANGKRWFYLPSSIESNDPDTKIVRYCFDDATTKQEIIRASFNEEITIGAGVTEIGDNFLYGCTAFNNGAATTTDVKPLVIPASVKNIGDDFLHGCISFNQNLTLQEGLETIGESFMSESSAFNRKITLPGTLQYVGNAFMFNCDAFNSLVVNCGVDKLQGDNDSLGNTDPESAQVTKGVAITGTATFADVQAKWPELTTGDVRRHLVQGQTLGYEVWTSAHAEATPDLTTYVYLRENDSVYVTITNTSDEATIAAGTASVNFAVPMNKGGSGMTPSISKEPVKNKTDIQPGGSETIVFDSFTWAGVQSCIDGGYELSSDKVRIVIVLA